MVKSRCYTILDSFLRICLLPENGSKMSISKREYFSHSTFFMKNNLMMTGQHQNKDVPSKRSSPHFGGLRSKHIDRKDKINGTLTTHYCLSSFIGRKNKAL